MVCDEICAVLPRAPPSLSCTRTDPGVFNQQKVAVINSTVRLFLGLHSLTLATWLVLQPELQSPALLDLQWAQWSAVHVAHGVNIPRGEIKRSFLSCLSPAVSVCFFNYFFKMQAVEIKLTLRSIWVSSDFPHLFRFWSEGDLFCQEIGCLSLPLSCPLRAVHGTWELMPLNPRNWCLPAVHSTDRSLDCMF